MQSSRNVLVLAYYYPPLGLSGVQRIAKLTKYLPQFGWNPTVLTVAPRGYFAFDQSLYEEVISAGVKIHATSSWDPTRIFSKSSKVELPKEGTRKRLSGLSQFLFVPDNKVGWYPFGVKAGKKLLKESPFDIICSTAPPYTSHLIALRLSRWGRIPLITDYRDDWVGNPRHDYATRLHRSIHLSMEAKVCQHSAMITTINRYIRDGLVRRHPTLPLDSKVRVLPQGFDPEDFECLCEPDGSTMRLVYAGVFYDAQRPDYFLRAFAAFLQRNPEAVEHIEAHFLGLVPAEGKALIKTLNLSGNTHCHGYVDHHEVLQALRNADVLWMTVGRREGAEGISTSKLFEYMGSRKPILGLVPLGAAREALDGYSAAFIVEPDDVQAISKEIEKVYSHWKTGTLPEASPQEVKPYDRMELAQTYGSILEDVLSRRT